MRKILFAILLIINYVTLFSQEKKGYEIKLKMDGFENKEVILGYHFRNSLHVKDTVLFDKKGIATFSGKEKLPGGIYLFYLPSGKYFDVMIDDEQRFMIETDSAEFIQKAIVTGSNNVKDFFDLQNFMEEKGKQAAQLREEIKTAPENSPEREQLSAKLKEINESVKLKWEEIETTKKGKFISKFISAVREPVLPDFEIPEGVTNSDSLLYFKRMQWIKEHYFDNIDLTDERMLRTQFFQQRIDYYFNTGVLQIPDTIADAAIKTIERSHPNREMFKYLVSTIFNIINESKVMGMDAALVAVAEKYYLSGEADWAGEKFLSDTRDRVKAIKPTLIGKKATDLKMESPDGEYFRLYEVNTKITILVFYEPSCSHCQKEMPLIYNDVYLPFRDKGVQVFAVYNLVDKKEWTAFIEKNKMFDWINVYDPHRQTNFREYYDIRTTPMIYVLDKDKKIVGKRIDVEQLPDFLNYLLNQ